MAGAKDAPSGRERGRPSAYSDAIVDEICELIAGGLSVREVCGLEHLPAETTVYRWLTEPEKTDFREKYALARERQADWYAREIIKIADGEGDVMRDRLRVDARKWHASKLAPKKYGEKITQEHTGDGGGPVRITEVRLVAPSTDDDGS